MTDALHSYTNPLPQVDPFFTEDDPKVDQEALKLVAIPADLDRDKDRFVQSLIDVAFVVDRAREGATWRGIEEDMKNTTSLLPVEFRKWCGLNHIDNFPRPVDLARYVHTDEPVMLHVKNGRYLLGKGVERMLYTGASTDAHFHRGRLAADAISGLMPSMVNPTAFAAKYKYKVPRPHRAITDILNGDVEVDSRDLRTLQRLTGHPEGRLEKPLEKFTLIDGATPNHWSYIAMHSTNAGASRLVAAACYNFAPGSFHDRQVCQHASQNGMGRLILGVHTAPDNVEGFRAGQTIAYNALPGLMEQLADADPDKVRRRLDDFMMDF